MNGTANSAGEGAPRPLPPLAVRSVSTSIRPRRMALIDNGLEILAPDECYELLRRGGVGRVAVTVAALPAIFPVNYAVIGDDIVFLTADGTKLRAATAHAVVAFEVDDYDSTGPHGWSVMAVGVAQEITDPDEIEAVRTLGPRPFAGSDRTHVVKIRSSSPDAGSQTDPRRPAGRPALSACGEASYFPGDLEVLPGFEHEDADL